LKNTVARNILASSSIPDCPPSIFTNEQFHEEKEIIKEMKNKEHSRRIGSIDFNTNLKADLYKTPLSKKVMIHPLKIEDKSGAKWGK
jgi:hypothetical protein